MTWGGGRKTWKEGVGREGNEKGERKVKMTELYYTHVLNCQRVINNKWISRTGTIWVPVLYKRLLFRLWSNSGLQNDHHDMIPAFSPAKNPEGVDKQ